MLLLDPAQTHAQQEHNPYEFTEVLELDSTMTMREVHATAKRWMADAFRDANSVVRIDDVEAGELMGKGMFTFTTSVLVESAVRHGIMRFSLEILSKPGKCRFRMYDFMHEGTLGRLSNGTPFQGSDLGLVYSTMPCFPAHKNGKVSTHTTNVCNTEVWPQVKGCASTMWSSFRKAMLDTKPANNSDW